MNPIELIDFNQSPTLKKCDGNQEDLATLQLKNIDEAELIQKLVNFSRITCSQQIDLVKRFKKLEKTDPKNAKKLVRNITQSVSFEEHVLGGGISFRNSHLFSDDPQSTLNYERSVENMIQNLLSLSDDLGWPYLKLFYGLQKTLRGNSYGTIMQLPSNILRLIILRRRVIYTVLENPDWNKKDNALEVLRFFESLV